MNSEWDGILRQGCRLNLHYCACLHWLEGRYVVKGSLFGVLVSEKITTCDEFYNM